MIHRTGERIPSALFAAALLALGLGIAERASSQTPPAEPPTQPPAEESPAAQAPPAQAPPAQAPPAQTPPPTPPPDRSPQPDPGPFAAGQKHFVLSGGYSASGGEDYLFIGGGLAYFIRNGLDLGVDLEAWFLGDPTYYKVSPQLRYTVWQLERTKPYFGGFYRRTIVENFEDYDSYGGRAGVYRESASGSIIGAGVVYERLVDCEDGLYGDCDDFYPEFVFALSF